jgi:hypothetical protein
MKHAKRKPYITTREWSGAFERAKPTHLVAVEWRDVSIPKRYTAISIIRKYVQFNTSSSLERPQTDFGVYNHTDAIRFEMAIEIVTANEVNTSIIPKIPTV